MVGLRIVSPNLKAWEEAARRTQRAISAPDVIRNVSIMLEARLKRTFKEQFRRQGAFGASGAWKPLSSKYGAWKKTNFPGKTILRRTDKMYRSFVQNPGSVGSKINNGFNYRYQSGVGYARYHQDGTDRMPQRKIVDLTKQQLTGMSAAIGRTIQEGLFSRLWFETRGIRSINFKNTGFDVVDI